MQQLVGISLILVSLGVILWVDLRGSRLPDLWTPLHPATTGTGPCQGENAREVRMISETAGNEG